ncbi:MAG: hypothetical protein KC931_26040, partial [Candidatus Omnitrophica bacterium]|nr:hypothetical protein [Candidatus Omnitrophota bacterium]
MGTLFGFLGVALAAPPPTVISSVEVWDGTSNPHAGEGVTLSGSGTWSDPFVYTLPGGLSITDRGVLRFSAAANFRLVFEGGGLDIQDGGLIDLNKGGNRLSSYLCTWDLGGFDITGAGRVDSSATGSHGLAIHHVRNVELKIIFLQRSDAAPAPVSINASGSVRIPGGIDASDMSPGGNQGGNVNVRADRIEIGDIRTGSIRIKKKKKGFHFRHGEFRAMLGKGVYWFLNP